MAKEQFMKWRLGLKLGTAEATARNAKPEQTAYVSWAAIRLGPERSSGSTSSLPYEHLDGPGEARVVVYERSEDMLEPLPVAQYEDRIKVVAGNLPDNCLIVRVPFDPAAYAAWLGSRMDGHENRAQWANTLDLDVVNAK